MDVSQVSKGADKDLSAVEFGGGMIWEVAQVEVQQGDDAENRRCNTPESEDQGWTVTTSKRMKRRQRKNEVRKTQEIQNQIEQKAVDIGKEFTDIVEKKDSMRVVGMMEDKIQVEVDERFIGAVIKENQLMTMTFQVAGVKKALAAVSKICKAGNVVQFGEEPSECFIMNKTTKKKVMLKQKRASYVINVEFVKKALGSNNEAKFEVIGQETITIDSGAEESVCPLGWGEGFGLNLVQPGKEMRMINAGGGVMPHFGSRKVQFAATGF